MKKKLLILIFMLMGASSQLCSMEEKVFADAKKSYLPDSLEESNYPLACKRLGVGPFPTEQEIDCAFQKKYKNSESERDVNLIRAKLALNSARISREFCKKHNTYRLLKSQVFTGLFTKQVIYHESDTKSNWVNCTFVDVYDYKRIFGALGILGTTAAGLAAYWYRNELSSLIKPILNPLFKI